MLLCLGSVVRAERDTLGVGRGISFVENTGQWAQNFRYEAQLHDAALFAEEGQLTIALRQHVEHPQPYFGEVHYAAYRMRFVGATNGSPDGLFQQEGYSNYYLGNDPGRWRSRVKSYATVSYADLYPNIDLEIYGAEKALKYNFIVHPGGSPEQIVIEYEGTDGVEVTHGGELRVRTAVRDIIEFKPYVFQSDGAKEIEVASRWRVSKLKGGLYRATIELGSYDAESDLVIDPTLLFSTYSGSTADNWGATAAYDASKNVYTAGLVFGVGYPTSLGAYQMSFGGGEVDVGIFKFDSSGAQRLYATYLGGTSSDMPHSMIVNSFNELILFGTTGSDDFPTTTGAYQTTFGGGQSVDYLSSLIAFQQGSDIFVSRFSEDGTQLQASTYIGGSGNDGLNYRQYYNANTMTVMAGNDSLYYTYGDGARGEIITDNLNNIYVGSTTFSNDFPTTAGCVQPASGGGQDGVVFKLDHNLRNLLWSSYLGGTSDDAIYSIDVDSVYNLLVCGGTSSDDFPLIEGGYQSAYGGGSTDGFVSKISYDGSTLMASTYVGERFYDQLYFVRVGKNDAVFLYGQTYPMGSSMIRNASYSVYNSGMLLMQMKKDLSDVVWSTVFGTNGRINLSPTAFGVDICNRVYAAGWGRDFVGYGGVGWNSKGTTGMETTTDAYSSTTDGQDFYLMSLDANAASLRYATFFGELHGGTVTRGSDHVDGGTSRFDRLATLYQSVCGSCGGQQGFPTTATAWSTVNNSKNCNNVVFRFNIANDFPVAEFTLPPTGCAPYTLQLENTGRGDSFEWFFGDGSTSSETSPTHTYTAQGTYTITLVAHLTDGCHIADTIRHTVQVLGPENHVHLLESLCNGTPVQIGVAPSLGATYAWSGDPVSDSTVANPWISNTGIYILKTTAEGCSQIDTFKVNAYTLIDQQQAIGISCHDSINGGYTFRLGEELVPDSISIVVVPTRPVRPITEEGGRYFFTIDSLAPDTAYHLHVEGYGCAFDCDVRLPNPPRPTYNKEATTALCTDSCAGSIYIQYNLGVIPELSYSDTLRSGLCPGVYVTELISNGCPLSDTTTIVRDHSLDNLTATAERTEIVLGESVRLHAYAPADSFGMASYYWSPASDVDNPSLRDPLATPTTTTACYTVTATSPAGCTATDTVCIHCTEITCGAPDFVIPNAFTPNEDGYNDRVCFNTDVLADFEIAIYNRWGQCVYRSTDASECWEGIYHDTPCPAGVYMYTCRVRCRNGIETDFKGDITLIR